MRFTTPVNFLPNGTEVLVKKPGEKLYSMETTPDVDANWNELLWGRYFSISEDEAKTLWGDDYRNYEDPVRSGWTGG